MKFIHISDLHIGRKLLNISLSDDQRAALGFIAEKARTEKPDALLISGDIYDKPIPSAEAVDMFDAFLTEISAHTEVFIIGGNHDSQPRLSFGSEILSKTGVHIARHYGGKLEKYTITDEFGEADIWLMPHIRPREAEIYFENADFDTDEDAVRAVIARENIDPKRRNILIAHLFARARGSEITCSDSEVNPIGGLNEVDISVFDAFSYVALGHLHAPQKVGRASARYSGSPVKYSFSEMRHIKSFVLGEMNAEGDVTTELVPIPQLHGMRELRGPLDALISPENAAQQNKNDFLRVMLTDAVPPLSPMERLTEVFPNVATLEFASAEQPAEIAPSGESMSPMELFADFYKRQTGNELTANMLGMAESAFDAAREAAEV